MESIGLIRQHRVNTKVNKVFCVLAHCSQRRNRDPNSCRELIAKHRAAGSTQPYWETSRNKRCFQQAEETALCKFIPSHEEQEKTE